MQQECNGCSYARWPIFEGEGITNLEKKVTLEFFPLNYLQIAKSFLQYAGLLEHLQ